MSFTSANEKHYFETKSMRKKAFKAFQKVAFGKTN